MQLTARLTHPNTVAVFDYGRTPDGVFYYAMEYLDGIDLEQLVERRRAAAGGARGPHPRSRSAARSPRRTSAGLIHRDVKPANIILCERGGMADVAKVVDFGLVKDICRRSGSRRRRAVHGEHRSSARRSTWRPRLSSPEPVDARGDLYALGAVAYCLLTGTPVFRAETRGRGLRAPPAHAAGAAVGSGSAGVPPDLERLVLRCLAKSPADRPQGARALLQELEGAAVGAWSRTDAANWWVQHRRTHPPASTTPS